MSDSNTPAAAPRLPKTESLEAKLKLLALLPYDKRARRKHSLVFGFILDWFHSKYGDALASVRHVVSTIKERDPAGKGLYAGDVHSALSDLVAWGFLHQEKGRGRRASRYVPNWALVCRVQVSPNTKQDEPSVQDSPNASVLDSPNATADSVRNSMNEDPSTPTRARDLETGIDGQDCAAPLAPPADGLAATAAVTAQGFEELWRVYDFKQKKKEARAAYAKLAPDAELHATMIEAAAAWRESWAAQNKPDAPRYTLAKWLEREDYECSPPTAFRPKERKAKATKAAPQPSSFRPEAAAPVYQPTRRRIARIVESEILDVPHPKHTHMSGGNKMWMKFRCDDGDEIEHEIILEFHDSHKQADGQRQFSELRWAVDVGSVFDTAELHDIPLIVIQKGNGEVLFEPATNDNSAQRAAA